MPADSAHRGAQRSTFLEGFTAAGTATSVTDPEALAQVQGVAWIDAPVPGGIHESLHAAGLIGAPYYGRQSESMQWIEERTWWYRCAFDAEPVGPRQRATLILHGVDTVASIWLNGRLLGRHASQFRPAIFDVTSALAGCNELLIRFDPPLHGLTLPADLAASSLAKRRALAAVLGGAPAPDQGQGTTTERDLAALRRKAILSWGWDFAPRLPSIGLYRPVELRLQNRVAITGHHLRTTALDTQARTADLGVDVTVNTFGEEGDLVLRLSLTTPDGHASSHDIALVGEGWHRRGQAQLRLHDVRPWWTHDLGAPELYRVNLVVLDSTATTISSVEDTIGIRTIALDQSEDDDEGGHLFRFVLNGVPVFARGANWVPPDLLPGAVTPHKCRRLVSRARAAGMTMLRVWGGGLYEQDAFYTACDEAGILVWQDFMFAAEMPSDSAELRAEAATEATYQVQRLRNHPCVALFAGNNEVQAMHQAVHGTLDPGNWGYEIFHAILPGVVARHGAGIPYWPSSPWSAVGDRVNGVLDGDRHAWEVWHGIDVGAGGPTEFADPGAAMHFRRYRHDRGKFISEFGIQSTPDMGTLHRWMTPGSLQMNSGELAHRDTDRPAGKAAALLAAETGAPQNVAQMVQYMAIVQAEGLKFGIEHYRRRQPHCSGTLVWQLNDAWPGFSWSLVDYDDVTKAAYHYVQRAYRPIIASLTVDDEDQLQLWVTNSGTAPVAATLHAGVSAYTGRAVIEEMVRATVPAGLSQLVWTAPMIASWRGGRHHAWVRDPSGQIPDNRLFFGPVKEQSFGAAMLDVDVEDHGYGAARVHIRSYGYNYFVHVAAPAPGVEFSDNYLDLTDGGTAAIDVSGLPDGVDLAVLQVRSMNATRCRRTAFASRAQAR